MVSGPPRGIFIFELLFFHSTPCFWGKFPFFFPEFSRFSGLSPRAQRPFSTPRELCRPVLKACVKPGRWGQQILFFRFLGCAGLFSEIGGAKKRQTPRFSKKMVSGPWRFSKIRPNFEFFRKFPKITPKIGVFPPIFADFRQFSGKFREISGPAGPGLAPTPNFREIFGKFSGPAGPGGRPP